MADVRAQLSILDRLIDEDPKKKEDPPISQSQSARQFREAVRRDLEWLLNTRSTAEHIEEELEQVQSSVYAYGLPDFSSYGVGSGQMKLRLRRALEQALEIFEPRLSNVIVTAVEAETEDEKRIMRFLITGLLRVDPAPEPVSFETLLDLNRGEYKIRKD